MNSPTALTPAECTRFLNAIDQTPRVCVSREAAPIYVPGCVWWRPFILVARDTGLNPGTVLMLKEGQFSFSNRTVEFGAAIYPVQSETADAILELLRCYKNRGPLLRVFRWRPNVEKVWGAMSKIILRGFFIESEVAK